MQVSVLPQASVTVYTRVLVQVQPCVLTAAPSAPAVITVGRPQLSIAVGVPAAGNVVGLQPRFTLAGHEVKTGLVWSNRYSTVCEIVCVLPQASVAVQVLVLDLSQN